MRLQSIRNATMILDYHHHRLLLDPYLADKFARPSYTGKSPNPLVDLPLAVDEILRDVEAVVVSHLHSDHFDPAAQAVVPKHLPLFCQPDNAPVIQEYGFQQVIPIVDRCDWNGITIRRVNGHHGLGEVEESMGTVSGFVFQASGEPTIYWAGDTVLCDEVRATITTVQPDMVIVHASGATWPVSSGERVLIVMDAAQTVQVCQLADPSTVIAVHMESLDHGTVSRADLRTAAVQAGISPAKLRIPADGEVIEL
ncbi:MAG TPA: MBL fold metallo-hydrolase [Aggregatilineaceae bacterium]|nr:MBL fold metallo-hydrolase [Aggregatilineaceae bacterium]